MGDDFITSRKVDTIEAKGIYLYLILLFNEPSQTSDPGMETVSQKVSRRSWARLIQKVYEVDPRSLRSKLLGSFDECQNYTWYVRNVEAK